MLFNLKSATAVAATVAFCIQGANTTPFRHSHHAEHHQTPDITSIALHDQSHCGDQELSSTTPLCSDLKIPNNTTTVEHSLCILPIKKVANQASENSIGRRQRPDRTPFEKDPTGNYMNWCFNIKGVQPNQNDVRAVCDSIPDNFTIARTSNSHLQMDYGKCLCHQWAVRGASYRACNCDRCDSLTKTDLKEDCRNLNALCPLLGHKSGYSMSMDFDKKENFLSILSGRNLMGDYWHELTDDKAVTDLAKSTCISENAHRLGQDYTGPEEDDDEEAGEVDKPVLPIQPILINSSGREKWFHGR